MLPGLSKLSGKLLAILAYGTLGSALTLLVVFITHLESRPALEIWHTVELDEEFTTRSGISSFAEYLALEDRLFAQLQEQVYDQVGTSGRSGINRYRAGSLSDPEQWKRNWNRSFELGAEDPRAAVLLLHGLSDSPYSVRSLAQALNRSGAQVVGLRLPGHGTAPAGLVDVRWQDMAAAVEIAVRHLAEQVPGKPLFLVGYSNGGALSLQYTFAAIERSGLPRIDRVVLISPEIAVAGAAALAVWQARLGRWLGLDKLAWNSLLPEYDPYKYGSFAVNAGDVAYRITGEIQDQLTALGGRGLLGELPPILAFTSIVDATVHAPALVDRLFSRIPFAGHELVLFDINDLSGIEPVLTWKPDDWYVALERNPARTFTLSLVTNEDTGNPQVHLVSRAPGEKRSPPTALDLAWPENVFSLSHVALPFPPDDPLYGREDPGDGSTLHLGALALRGERGVLQISASDMLRLRWNPFYTLLEDRMLQFLELDGLDAHRHQDSR